MFFLHLDVFVQHDIVFLWYGNMAICLNDIGKLWIEITMLEEWCEV